MTTQDQPVTGRRLFPAWASNFSPSLIEYDGVRYPTVEHAYQAHKTTDRSARHKVAALPRAVDAKQWGNRVKMRPDWEQIKIKVMLDCLRLKFKPGTAAFHQLMTYDASADGELVEWNRWHDNFWGDCICDRPECRPPGRNVLGKLLTRLRMELLA